jgi:hypothetical protein
MLLFIVSIPHRAAAQGGGPIDVAGGYAFMRDYDGAVTFPRGWFGSVGADVAGPVGIVGAASGSYKAMSGLDIRMSMNIQTFMGGSRVALRRARVAPFAEALLGTARIARTFALPGETVSDSTYHFAMQVGGGVDVQLARHIGTRVAANRRLIRSETYTPTGSEPFNYREFQFVAGLVVR